MLRFYFHLCVSSLRLFQTPDRLSEWKEEGNLIFTHGFGGHGAWSDLLTALRPALGVDFVGMKEHSAE